MIYLGIDVSKDKHDCFITNSDGEVLSKSFTISNNREGFDTLFQKIISVSDDLSKVKVGLEATGHYSYNLLGFLLDKGLPTYVINPLHTNLYRKSLSLRKTKTDKVDSRTIATMMMSDMNLKSYSDTSYHNGELKSLTRYRFDKVKERAKLKTSVSRLVCILFPELEKLVPTLHMASVYALLSEFPGANAVAAAHLTRLSNLLSESSKGRYGKDTAVMFREAARSSIGSRMPAKSLELKHTRNGSRDGRNGAVKKAEALKKGCRSAILELSDRCFGADQAFNMACCITGTAKPAGNKSREVNAGWQRKSGKRQMKN